MSAFVVAVVHPAHLHEGVRAIELLERAEAARAIYRSAGVRAHGVGLSAVGVCADGVAAVDLALALTGQGRAVGVVVGVLAQDEHGQPHGAAVEYALELARAVRAGEVVAGAAVLEALELERGIGTFAAPEALGLAGAIMLQDYRP